MVVEVTETEDIDKDFPKRNRVRNMECNADWRVT
jgi:hypothetical protein